MVGNDQANYKVRFLFTDMYVSHHTTTRIPTAAVGFGVCFLS